MKSTTENTMISKSKTYNNHYLYQEKEKLKIQSI